MRAFYVSGQTFTCELDDTERDVLAQLVEDVAMLLGSASFAQQAAGFAQNRIDQDWMAAPAVRNAPHDPALQRLLPDVSPDDGELSADFRRFTENDLRAAKVSRLHAVWVALVKSSQDETAAQEWNVAPDQALDVLAALTDVRLVLASRLGLGTEEQAQELYDYVESAQALMDDDSDATQTADQNPERLWLGTLYQALTWLQESLLQCVTRDDV